MSRNAACDSENCAVKMDVRVLSSDSRRRILADGVLIIDVPTPRIVHVVASATQAADPPCRVATSVAAAVPVTATVAPASMRV
ncbi:MAG: hypothetical protein ACK40J_00845 [Rhodococcus sp. (in: high G+C Gram-positive bacteria)]|nr:hypothetical protein [uncultured Rhodococcus sp.]